MRCTVSRAVASEGLCDECGLETHRTRAITRRRARDVARVSRDADANASIAMTTPTTPLASARADVPGETTRRRKSRWERDDGRVGDAVDDGARVGDAVDDAARVGVAVNDAARVVADGSESKRRRKSRWESDADVAGASDRRDEDLGLALVPERAREATVASALTQPAMMTNALVIGSGIFVQLPTSVLAEHSAPADATPEVHFLFAELGRLNRRLIAGAPFDDRPGRKSEAEPAPIYDANGVRVNTRDVVEREKFTHRRMELLEEICHKCPTFRPPPDYRPNKRIAKLLIPVDEYPGYNFFGLIIGPRGSTQKQMQRETNTKIVIRGKGSAKGGTGAAERNNEFEHEPLHVVIEGDVQSDVDKAKAMIEKLLIPVDEDMNEHKRQQLRELALMNGTWRDESSIEAMQKRLDEEMASGAIYQLPDPVKKAVEATYRKDVERLHGAGAGGTLDVAYSDFLSELGVDGRGRSRRIDESADDDRKVYVGRLPPTATAESLREKFSEFNVVDVACIPDTVLGHSCKGFAFVTVASPEDAAKAASTMNGTMFEDRVMEVRLKNAPREQLQKETSAFDPDANLYVGGLTESMNEDTLRDIFAPYGLVQKVKVIRDHATQQLKGYGFVQMMDPSHAQAAILALDGQFFSDSVRPFTVRIAGQSGGSVAQAPAGGFANHMAGFGAPAYGGFPAYGVPPAYGAPPPMMMMDPLMAAYYGGVDPYAGAFNSHPTVELGNPDEAPPPPPEEDGAPPPMPMAPPQFLSPDGFPILPGVAPPAPPPMPPPPK